MPAPLHPVIVHVPLVLAGVVPFVVGWLTWRAFRGGASRRAWLVALALQAVVVGGALVALETGGDEEERVEQVVPEAAIEAHEARAELFTIGAGVAGLLIAGAVALRGRASGAAGAAATAASLVVVLLGVRTGSAGGELVYQHGAAAVYAHTQPALAGDAPVAADRDDD